ncbi:LOW QUALITY PROTEIN: hypothetical protein QTO34_014752 [Cnephaeus nilssonii]|uniref:DDE-1 domain-containing protein n=1 Tax=Cnephaeus nilssonii TaxID=3371016 RepID=A0AA40I857_CNENI|nr:LOW QUALITY PROTEIN: hypothetical protein QTO34_014752 [Eptesicus nilssonii]
MTQIIGNCVCLLILSSALPVFSRALGLTRFDLLGDFGCFNWLGNFYIVFLYDATFAGLTTLCLVKIFTTAVRAELIRAFGLNRLDLQLGVRGKKLDTAICYPVLKRHQEWKERKKRSCLHNIQVQAEITRAAVEAAASYPEDLAKKINEGGYIQKTDFQCRQNSLLLEEDAIRTFIVREEKSMPGVKASDDRLTLEANTAGGFKWKPVLIYHSEDPRALKNYSRSTLPVLYKWNNKAWKTTHLFAIWFTEYFSSLLRTIIQKKVSFHNIIDNAPGHSRALMEMCNEIDVFTSANTTCILQPMNQGVISSSYYLVNTPCKVIAAIDSDSSDGSWQIHHSDAIKNSHGKRSKYQHLTGIWKKLIPTLMDDFEGFKTSVEEVTADVVETARELVLEVDPKDVTEFCNLIIKL